MSIEMSFVLASDEQIAYLREHQHHLDQFLAGTLPAERPSLFARLLLGRKPQTVVPEIAWPSQPTVQHHIEVNHRAVEHFHFLLNGNDGHSSGAGRIFETWFRPQLCEDLLLQRGVYALNAASVHELFVLLNQLSPATIIARSRQRDPDADEADADEDAARMMLLNEVVRKANEQAVGLICIPS